MIVEATGITVRFGPVAALNRVDLTARPGEVLAVVGPNGSGKSTLVKVLAGLLRHDGTVRYGGASGRPSATGYMPQDSGARAALTVIETVLLGRLDRLRFKVSSQDLDDAIAVLTELDLSHLAMRDIRELSGGQRQLVFLAQALACEPRLLLLDEPLSALDIRHQLTVMDTLVRLTRDKGLTTLAVVHDLAIAARYGDRILMLKEGLVVGHGSPRNALTRESIASAFDVDVSVHIQEDGHMLLRPLGVIGH